MRGDGAASYGPPMHPRLLLTALLPLVALPACGGDDGGGGDPVAATEVTVVDDDFRPAAITVDEGATVTWTWEGSNAHDVQGDGFASEIQSSGSFEHTFTDAGEHEYRCSVHPGMRGRVVVR